MSIYARELRKVFSRPRRIEGPFGTVRTLLSRQRVETVAVHDVSFTIGEGELVGYLGPNGAGKSTTIKMLTGVLTPSGGEILVRGRVPWRDRSANARDIGVVFGQRTQLWWDLPLIESMRLIAALYDLPPQRFRHSLKRMSDLLGLDGFLETPVRQLSLGQRMRGDLAAAMLYQPPILYLDEPTVGLDVLAKEAVRDFIAETNRTGDTTVVLTTHDLDDVAALCRRIILIDNGRVLYDGGIDSLVARYAMGREVIVTLAAPEVIVTLAAPEVIVTLAAPEVIVTLAAQQETLTAGAFAGERAADGRYHFTIGADDAVPTLLSALSDKHAVRDLTVTEPALEDVIKRIYAGEAA